MEYAKEDNGATGCVPEFGAIFTVNVSTKKECFKQKVFALPSSKAGFVKHIKAGMVLFMFQYDTRQLFGVYQASSDGAMNIVPHAFSHYGQQFPAQVSFTPIWYCAPLSEKEFRGAIRENYFSANKFNFGLSEDQVRRLLHLFSSRKLGNPMPPPPLAEVGDDRFASGGRGYEERTVPDEFNAAVSWDHQVNKLGRVKDDEFLNAGGISAEGEVYTSAQEEFLAKRRRIVNDDRLITNDVAENVIYNYGTSRNCRFDSLKDPSDEGRQLADAHRLLAVEHVHGEKEADKICSPVLSSEYLMGTLDARAAADRFVQRNELLNEFNMDNSSRQAFASGRYVKPLDKGKHAIEDERFLFADRVQRQLNDHHIVKPIAYGDDNLDLHRQAREAIDDHQCLMNMKLEIRYPLDYDGITVGSSENSANLFHKIRKTSDERILINDRLGIGPNFVTCSLEDYSSGNLSRQLHCGQRDIHDREYPNVEGRMIHNTVDSMLCSAASTRNTGFIASVDGRVVDDRSFRTGERLDNEEEHTLNKPVMSMKYPSFTNQNQSFSSLSNNFPEEGLTLLTAARDFNTSHSAFDKETMTRGLPCIPEHPNYSHGCSSSMTTNPNGSLVREDYPHHGSLGKIYSLSNNRSSPHRMESQQCSRSLDFLPDFGNKGLTSNTSGHISLLREPNSSFLNSIVSTRMGRSTSAGVNSRGSVFPRLSASSLCSNDCEIEAEKEYLFAYPSKSTKNDFTSNGHAPTASQDGNRMDMDMLAGKDHIFSEAKDFKVEMYHQDRHLDNYENQHFRTSSNMDLKEHHNLDSSGKRRSVFTRLTSRQELQVGGERNDSHLNSQQSCMDATADQVMEILQKGNNQSSKKPKNSKVIFRPSKHEESAVVEKTIPITVEITHSAVEKKRLNDTSLAVAECTDEVPGETRVVDFKRRSETKKNLDGISNGSTSDSKTSDTNREVESSKTTLRRRKLVRPVFRKTESGVEAVGNGQNLQPSTGQILDKDDKKSCEGEMPSNMTRSGDMLSSPTGQSMEHSNPERQKDAQSQKVLAQSHELKQTVTSQVYISSNNTDATAAFLNLEKSSPNASKLGVCCESNLIQEENTRVTKCRRKLIRTRPAWSLPTEGGHVS